MTCNRLMILFLMVSLLLPPQAIVCYASKLPSADAVFERYVNAIGGREAIEQAPDRVIHFLVVTDLPSRKPAVHTTDTLTVFLKSPNRYLTITRFADGGVKREVWNGEQGWREENGVLSEYPNLMNSSLAKIYSLKGALNLRELYPEIKVNSQEVYQGNNVYSLKNPDDYTLFFYVDSGWLAGLGYHHEITDYREVDGVMIPHRVIFGRKGGSTIFYIDHIESGVELDDSLFEMLGK